MEISNLSSGLLGALIGAVIGGAMTYFGQRRLSEHDLKRRRMGVVKALLGELLHNTTRAVGVASHRQFPSPYVTAVWDGGMFEIAQFTNRHEFVLLLQSYGQVDIANRQSEDLLAAPNSGAEQDLRVWYEVTRRGFNMLLEDDRLKDATAEWQPMDSFEQESARARQSAR